MDVIEVLAPSLLNEMPELVAEMQSVIWDLRSDRGWHYYMDFCWTARAISPTPGMKILDAGGGNGTIQWWLASQGADVLSIDLNSRPHPGRRFDHWCRHSSLGDGPGYQSLGLRSFLPPKHFWSKRAWQARFSETRHQLFPAAPRHEGSVVFWDHDLRDLSRLETGSMDAIVSISALEHNDLEALEVVISELERVLKPGGKMAITLGGSREEDWFHEPSKGWCFSEKSLAHYFGLDAYETNFERYDEILEDLITCDFLRQDLPQYYFEGGENGMPWGEWNPAYQSVGVIKTKR